VLEVGRLEVRAEPPVDVSQDIQVGLCGNSTGVVVGGFHDCCGLGQIGPDQQEIPQAGGRPYGAQQSSELMIPKIGDGAAERKEKPPLLRGTKAAEAGFIESHDGIDRQQWKESRQMVAGTSDNGLAEIKGRVSHRRCTGAEGRQ
jgi:hypothetical protein